MGQARGFLSKLLIDFETTFGSNPGSPAGKIVPINSYDVSASKALNAAQTITGNRNPVMPFAGNTSVSGNAEVPLDTIAFGWWLKAMFGSETVIGSGPYTHVFKLGSSQPSLVCEKKYDFVSSQQYVRQNGIKISSLGLSFGGDGELTAKLGIVGATEQAPNGTTYNAGTVISFNRLSNFQAAILEGGGAISNVTQLDINVDFGLDTSNYTIGAGGTLGDIPEGIAKVSGKLTTLFQDVTLLNKAINQTETSLKVTCTSGAHSLAFELQELFYALKSPGVTGPQGLKCELEFQAFYDNGAGASSFIATLINAQATY